MIWYIIAVLAAFGLTIWLIGELLDYTGVSVIGGTILIIAGSLVALTGLEIRTGEVRAYEYGVVNNTTVRTDASVSYSYQTTALAQLMNLGALGSLGFGGLIMLLGTVLISHSLGGDI